jgi:hypothetical protein
MRPVRMIANLLPSSVDVTESGSLNLPEPSGPHRPVMGVLYLFLITRTAGLKTENSVFFPHSEFMSV